MSFPGMTPRERLLAIRAAAKLPKPKPETTCRACQGQGWVHGGHGNFIAEHNGTPTPFQVPCPQCLGTGSTT